MKPLLPTLKERHRYVVYEVITADPLRSDVSEALMQRLSEILGVFGTADAGVLSVAYDQHRQAGILRVAHTQVARVRGALLMIGQLGHARVLIRTLGVSGMLGKARRFLPEEGKHDATTATPDDGV